MRRVEVMVVVGTRPEALKLAPVITELRSRPDDFTTVVVTTAQHRQMQDRALAVFDIEPDHDLDLMKPGQTLDDVVAGVLGGVGRLLDARRPDWVLVQGDTSTAFAAALAAFHRRVRVGHVEAGLRSGRRREPFPEEANRTMVARVADLHFAPTDHAAQVLIDEGIDGSDVVVSGNTIIDALHTVLDAGTPALPPEVEAVLAQPTILVTAHRRENHGAGLARICAGLLRVAAMHRDHRLLYPVHPNPAVRVPVRAALGAVDNVTLIDPLDYVDFVNVMRRVELIITDSGGIQEEATALAKPTLVMRDVTERPEAVDAGVTTLVGTDPDRIACAAAAIIADPIAAARRASDATTLYGDGNAAKRIADALR